MDGRADADRAEHDCRAERGDVDDSRRHGGEVLRIPVLVEGSRTNAFAVVWQASDLTARYGEDFVQSEGMVAWSSVTGGTKYVELPLGSIAGAQAGEQTSVKGVRTYRIWGKVDLADSEGGERRDGWRDVNREPGDYHFFKVTVDLP